MPSVKQTPTKQTPTKQTPTKQTPTKQTPTKPWSMYPSLHDQVARLLEDDNLSFAFHEADDSKSCDKAYDTNIMGRFICWNRSCSSNGWASNRVAITIRMYSESRYNARVYHQRCKSCKRLSQPTLNKTYAERVAYRIKKWQGIEQQRPPYSEEGISSGPHNSLLCEGCKAGHCKVGQVDDISHILQVEPYSTGLVD